MANIDWKKAREGFLHLKRLSERGTVIVGAAYLDQELEGLLRHFFIDNNNLSDKLLKEMGPLSSFYARIETAFALGLISEQERKNLNIIRDLRNEFAHKPDRDVTFETPKIRDKCMALEAPKQVPQLAYPLDQPEGRFMATWSFLLLVLVYRRDQLARREKPESITDDVIRSLWEKETSGPVSE